MKRFMRAVTLVEVLVTMGIIGVISMFAIATIKPYEKTYKYLYTRIINVLETGVYNSMLKRSEFPTTSTEFCNMLTEYLNTAENNCTTAADLSEPTKTATFPEENIKLILSNGMYVWLGSNGGAPFTKTETITGNKYSIKFYLVFVDITGSKPPNRVDWQEGGKLADIVAFAVTEASVVIPLGPPEIDPRYMTARVIYLPYDENFPEGNKSSPVSYAAAKSMAWGQSKVDSELRSWQFNSVFQVPNAFVVDYGVLPAVVGTEQCTAENGVVSPCFVKIDNYN